MLTHTQTSAPFALNGTKVTTALEMDARCDFESLCVGLSRSPSSRRTAYLQTPSTLDKMSMFVVYLATRRGGSARDF